MNKEIKHGLKIRKKIKKTTPRFKRQELGRQPELKDVWRKPRGLHSKMKQHEKPRGKMPSIGYGSPKSVRGLNRQGYREVIISTPKDLRKVDVKSQMAVISGRVGRKKRFEIKVLAEKLGIKVSN
jgi:large subunit ribosomal protein L32e